jgi:MraZ protein
MYIGRFEVQVEAKNRVAFPSRFRAEMGKNLLIANWFEQSIIILKKNDLESFLTEVRNKSVLDPDVRDIERFIFGGMEEVILDRQGRFVVPAFLRQHAQIKTRVTFIGAQRHIELWDTDIWENYYQMINLGSRKTAERILKHE